MGGVADTMEEGDGFKRISPGWAGSVEREAGVGVPQAPPTPVCRVACAMASLV